MAHSAQDFYRVLCAPVIGLPSSNSLHPRPVWCLHFLKCWCFRDHTSLHHFLQPALSSQDFLRRKLLEFIQRSFSSFVLPPCDGRLISPTQSETKRGLIRSSGAVGLSPTAYLVVHCHTISILYLFFRIRVYESSKNVVARLPPATHFVVHCHKASFSIW